MTRTVVTRLSRPGPIYKRRIEELCCGNTFSRTIQQSESLRQEKDIAALATVWITSEAVDYPIDNAFDRHRGPGSGSPDTGTTKPSPSL